MSETRVMLFHYWLYHKPVRDECEWDVVIPGFIRTCRSRGIPIMKISLLLMKPSSYWNAWPLYQVVLYRPGIRNIVVQFQNAAALFSCEERDIAAGNMDIVVSSFTFCIMLSQHAARNVVAVKATCMGSNTCNVVAQHVTWILLLHINANSPKVKKSEKNWNTRLACLYCCEMLYLWRRHPWWSIYGVRVPIVRIDNTIK